VVADPVQVSGDSGEASGPAGGASLTAAEGHDAHDAVALVQDQRTAGVAAAGGLAAVGVDADGVVRDVVATVVVAAVVVVQDLDVHAVQVVGQAAVVVGPTPAGGHCPPAGEAVVAIVVAGQLHLVDQAPEVHVGDADQGDVVVQVVVPVGVLDHVAAAHPVGVFVGVRVGVAVY